MILIFITSKVRSTCLTFSPILLRTESRERFLRTQLECIEEHSPEGTLTNIQSRGDASQDQVDRKLMENRTMTQTQLIGHTQALADHPSQFNGELQLAYYQHSSTSGSLPKSTSGTGAPTAPDGRATEIVFATASRWPNCVRRHAAAVPCGDGFGESGGNGCDSNFDLLQASVLKACEKR